MHSIFLNKYVHGSSQPLDEELINTIHNKLTIRISAEFDKDWLIDILWRWSQFSDSYKDPLTESKKTEIDNEIITLKNSIANIKNGIRGLEVSKKIELIYLEPLPPQVIDIDKNISDLEKYQKSLQFKLAYLIGIESNNANTKKRLKQSLLQVMAAGIGIGLKNNGKAHAGRRHTNQLFEFVSIITGIEDKETISRHYKSHQELIETPITYVSSEPQSTP